MEPEHKLCENIFSKKQTSQRLSCAPYSMVVKTSAQETLPFISRRKVWRDTKRHHTCDEKSIHLVYNVWRIIFTEWLVYNVTTDLSTEGSGCRHEREVAHTSLMAMAKNVADPLILWRPCDASHPALIHSVDRSARQLSLKARRTTTDGGGTILAVGRLKIV